MDDTLFALQAESKGTDPRRARIDDQRDALRARIDALRRSGALPTAQDLDPPESAVQWNNWSNG